MVVAACAQALTCAIGPQCPLRAIEKVAAKVYPAGDLVMRTLDLGSLNGVSMVDLAVHSAGGSGITNSAPAKTLGFDWSAPAAGRLLEVEIDAVGEYSKGVGQLLD